MNMRTILATTAASAVLFTLGACGSDTDSGGTEGAAGDGLELITADTLTVCADVPYPPFEDYDDSTETGYAGFDIDIVDAIATGLDLELVVKDSSFDGLQSGLALNAGQCDIAASAMTITDDRKANLDFSDGYYDSMQSLLVLEDSEIGSIEDLAGVKVGVQQGTTGQAYAMENAPEANLVVFPSDGEMYQAIQAGQVEALLQDLPVNVEHTRSGPYTIVEEYPTEEQYGLAMKKGNTALVEAVNEQLTELRDSGRYDELYDQYFAEN